MTHAQRARIAGFFSEVRNGLTLAVLTAILTIAIAMILSALVGGESRALLRQAVFNGEETVDHAIVARCEMAHVAEMLRAIGNTDADVAESLRRFPPINTEGIDCDTIIVEPFRPGNDFGLEGPASPAVSPSD